MSLSTFTRRLTYANVTSTACLFILLGGSAYAATAITGSDVRNGSLTSADVRDHTLLARDFKTEQLPRGPQGDRDRPASRARQDRPAPRATRVRPARRVRPVPPARSARRPRAGSRPAASSYPGSRATARRARSRSAAWPGRTCSPATRRPGAAPRPRCSGATSWSRRPPIAAPRSSGSWPPPGSNWPRPGSSYSRPARNRPTPTYSLKAVNVASFSTLGSGEERRDEVALRFDPAMQPNPVFTFDAAAPLPVPSEPRVGRMTVDGIPGEAALVLGNGERQPGQPHAVRAVRGEQARRRHVGRTVEPPRLRPAHPEGDDQAAPARLGDDLHDVRADGRRRLVARRGRGRTAARAARPLRGARGVDDPGGRRGAIPAAGTASCNASC